MAKQKLVQTKTGVETAKDVQQVGGSVPKEQLLPPPPLVSKTAKWNAAVERENFDRQQQANTFWSDALKDSDQKYRANIADFQTQANVQQAPVVEKLKAFYEAGKETNDFFAIGKTLRKQDFKPDAEWQGYVQDKEAVNTILDGFGVPRSYATIVSQTVSQEDFVDFAKAYQLDQEKKQFINERLGDTGKTAAAIAGSLAGLDTVVGIAMPWLAINKGRKIMQGIQTAQDAERAARALSSTKTIATYSGLGYSVTAPIIKSQVHEDYTFTDGVVDALLFGSVDTYFITARTLAKQHSEINAFREVLKQREILGALPNGSNLLPFKRQNQLLLPYYPKEDDVIIAQNMRRDGVIVSYPEQSNAIGYVQRLGIPLKAESGVGGVIANAEQYAGKITNRLTEITKRMDDLNSQVFGKRRISTYKKEAMLKEVDDLTLEMNSLKKIDTEIKKTKNIAKKQKKIENAKLKFPSIFTDEAVQEATDILPDVQKALNDIVSHPDAKDIEEAVNLAAKEAGGKRFIMKKDANGNMALGVKGKDGKFKPITGKQKVAAGVVLSMLASSSAMAEDGEGNVASDLSSFALGAFALYFLGGQFGKRMLEHKGVFKALGGIGSDFTKAMANKAVSKTPEGEYVGKVYGMYNQTLQAIGTLFKDTYYRADATGKQMIKDLLWDAENTSVVTVDRIKNQRHEANMVKFYSVYNDAWKTFFAERRKNANGFVDGWLQINAIKREFNEAITAVLEKPETLAHPSVKKVAPIVREIYDDIAKRANEARVQGFKTSKEAGEGAMLLNNYVTRVLKSSDIYRLAGAMGEWGAKNPVYDALEQNLRRMYSNAHPSATADDVAVFAEEYLMHIKNSVNTNIRGTIGDLLGDQTARSKFRIDLDTSAWEDFTLNVNGKETVVGLDNLFERDIESLLMGYSNAMEGHIALAIKRPDWQSYTVAMNQAGEMADPIVRRNMTIALNLIIGRQNFDSSSQFAQFMRASGNIASGIFMPLSAIMQIKEAGSTLLRSAKNFETFKDSVKEFKNVLKGRGSDDAVTSFIMDMDAKGQHMMTHKLHSRMYDDFANVNEDYAEGLVGAYLKSSQRFRDAAMITYGVAPLTDWGQRVNGMLNMNVLAQVAHGKKVLNRTDMEAFGFTPERLTLARKYLKLNEQDNLTKSSVLSLEKNSKDYDEIANMIYNMGQTQMLSPALGTTPAFLLESNMGQAVGTLMSFAMNAHAVYGTNLVKGMARGEPASYIDTLTWFGAMYAAQMLKDEIKGVERDDRELVMNAMVNMPFMAPSAIVGMVTDPVLFAGNEKIQTEAYATVETLLGAMGE